VVGDRFERCACPGEATLERARRRGKAPATGIDAHVARRSLGSQHASRLLIWHMNRPARSVKATAVVPAAVGDTA